MTWSVYQITQGDKPIYIGVSNNPERRFKQHRRAGISPLDAHLDILAEFQDYDYGSAARAEIALIQRIRPPKNKRDNKVHNFIASRLWFNLSLSEEAALNEMVGWSRSMARQMFGSRVITSNRRECLKRWVKIMGWYTIRRTLPAGTRPCGVAQLRRKLSPPSMKDMRFS